MSHIGDVQFIDYEYSGYNYLAYDIGNHFNEFAGITNRVTYVALKWYLQNILFFFKANKLGAGATFSHMLLTVFLCFCLSLEESRDDQNFFLNCHQKVIGER